MGLLYLFPDHADDPDHVIAVEVNGQRSITVRTYGLPPLFWGYLVAILMVLSLMVLAVIEPLKKLLSYPDTFNQLIGYGLIAFLVFSVLTLLSLYFFEKNLTLHSDQLTITHKVFFIPMRRQVHELQKPWKFVIQNFVDSPNLARIKDELTLKAFQNKGYFELFLQTPDQKIWLDRHNRKTDLIKLTEILHPTREG